VFGFWSGLGFFRNRFWFCLGVCLSVRVHVGAQIWVRFRACFRVVSLAS